MTSQSDLDVQRVAAARLWAATRFPYLASALFATRLLPLHQPGVVAVDEAWRVFIDPDLVRAWRRKTWPSPLRQCSPQRLDASRAALRRSTSTASRKRAWSVTAAAAATAGRSHGTGLAAGELSGPKVPTSSAARWRWRHSSAAGGLMPGTVPVGLRRWAEGLLGARADWRRVLSAEIRRGVAAVAGAVDYSYKRPSRRAAAVPDVVMPTMLRPVPEVAVVVDTSGSMSEQLLGRALSEVDGLLRSPGLCQRRLPVLPCDAAVHAVQKVTSARQVELLGGGGTNMGEGIEAACRLRPPESVVVVLTDGFTPWPSEPPGGVRVIVGLLRKCPTRTPG